MFYEGIVDSDIFFPTILMFGQIMVKIITRLL